MRRKNGVQVSILPTTLSVKVPHGSFVELFVGKFCGACALNLSRQKKIAVAKRVGRGAVNHAREKYQENHSVVCVP